LLAVEDTPDLLVQWLGQWATQVVRAPQVDILVVADIAEAKVHKDQLADTLEAKELLGLLEV
jgi:hypothetical protein